MAAKQVSDKMDKTGGLEPVSPEPAKDSWSAVMKDVWAAQKHVKERQPNPVIEERKRRRR